MAATGKSRVRKSRPAPEKDGNDQWLLRLYIAGQTPNSVAAVSNLKRLCAGLDGKYRIEIIDLLVHPTLAKGDQIVAVPTLVRKLPPPMKRIIGNLSKADRALIGLDLQRTP